MPGVENRIGSLPCWSGSIDIAPLKGGLSNESYLVTDGNGRHVVRFGLDLPFHHVSRERELAVARTAHAAGFAPRVEYAEQGVMVAAFIEGRTFNADDVRRERDRIVRFLRDFHLQMPRRVAGAAFIFWVFHVIRDYARTLEIGRSRMVVEVPFYIALADELEAQQAPLPIVFGHHDLLPANFLDDGERLWLIDFEYAGFGTAAFDLAGLASNADMSSEEAEATLATYFDAAPDPRLLRSHSAMQCASLLREAMWSMVSELHLDAPGVDYVAYTDDNLARLRARLEEHRTSYGTAAS